eukprot:TRINITY_DN17439_c0_g1_i1.p1 TRINITY_DN17439_c0_g1~~TRINITY_DN17439_c0_g1_i1.p1  ORF type:complete len:347 (-),score=38.84 TRINITY_DN17439_c0_g1_i1:322-1362(-)
MGYPTRLFQDPVEEEFLCIVCQEVMQNPVEARCCRQLYCKECLDSRMARNPLCVSCERGLQTGEYADAHPVLESLLGRKVVRCKNEAAGCPIYCQLKDMSNHESKQCLYRLCKCTFGCGYEGVFINIQTHSQECKNRNSAQSAPVTGEQILSEMFVYKSIFVGDIQHLESAFQSLPSGSTAPPTQLNLSPASPHIRKKGPTPTSPPQALHEYVLSMPSALGFSDLVTLRGETAATTLSPHVLQRPVTSPSGSSSRPESAPLARTQVQQSSASANTCSHRWVRDACRICVECLQCSEYGRSCVCHRENPNRRVQGKDLCGCGSGVSGCTHCHLCWRCAGLSRAPSVR